MAKKPTHFWALWEFDKDRWHADKQGLIHLFVTRRAAKHHRDYVRSFFPRRAKWRPVKLVPQEPK